MKEISLTQGQVALVDDHNFEWLNQWKWTAHKDWRGTRYNYYAVRSISAPDGKRTLVRMHQVILKVPPGYEVDHKDGDGTHNWEKNLRAASKKENSRNKGFTKSNTSGVKGVSWDSANQKWRAKIGVDRKTVCLGRFSVLEDAARAYDTAAKQFFGSFAKTNA